MRFLEIPSATNRLFCNISQAAVLTLLATLSLPANSNNDSLVPIYESLQYRQQQQYMKAAPAGNDQPIQVQINHEGRISSNTEAPVSMLAKKLEEQTKELSLAEKRTGQAIEKKLEQFGYNIFQRSQNTQELAKTTSVPESYRLGAGDTIIVQLYGKRNVEYNLVVTREGKLLIPELGPIPIDGLTFLEMKDLITSEFQSRVIGAKAAITMGNVRSLQVRLTGDVVAPGTYTVNGLSTLIDALLSSGGVNFSGSLRKIQLLRADNVSFEFDLYELLLRGNTAKDLMLKHNDVIFVPPIGNTVSVGGEVQRPAIYELKNETNLDQIIAMAGGLLPTASIEESHIDRIVDRKYRTLISLKDVKRRNASNRILPGDYIRIMPLDEKLDRVVMFSGHVKRPGAYELKALMRVSDLIPKQDGLLRNADLDIAILKREEVGTKRTIVHYLDLDSILQSPGTEKDILLQARDEVVIFNLEGNRSASLQTMISEMDIQATEYRPAKTVSGIRSCSFSRALSSPGSNHYCRLTQANRGIATRHRS